MSLSENIYSTFERELDAGKVYRPSYYGILQCYQYTKRYAPIHPIRQDYE